MVSKEDFLFLFMGAYPLSHEFMYSFIGLERYGEHHIKGVSMPLSFRKYYIKGYLDDHCTICDEKYALNNLLTKSFGIISLQCGLCYICIVCSLFYMNDCACLCLESRS